MNQLKQKNVLSKPTLNHLTSNIKIQKLRINELSLTLKHASKVSNQVGEKKTEKPLQAFKYLERLKTLLYMQLYDTPYRQDTEINHLLRTSVY